MGVRYGLVSRFKGQSSEPFIFQSHLSENKKECEWVNQLHQYSTNYTDVYRRSNLLGPKVSQYVYTKWRHSKILTANEKQAHIVNNQLAELMKLARISFYEAAQCQRCLYLTSEERISSCTGIMTQYRAAIQYL